MVEGADEVLWVPKYFYVCKKVMPLLACAWDNFVTIFLWRQLSSRRRVGLDGPVSVMDEEVRAQLMEVMLACLFFFFFPSLPFGCQLGCLLSLSREEVLGPLQQRRKKSLFH